ncbi:hypothetical protein JVX96_24395 [Variovorax sp. PDNC026]|uniref:hypothetical protein n=1 Tax=Variovorax sp. PDNC026 TaxID=2811425 RepID=UPI00196501DC|nr:hypothetical protein [Variovorax sp. PDNC026]QRY31186.1 hypothetical protein JVX96_24395 [Variovorax sp. PDNC026]
MRDGDLQGNRRIETGRNTAILAAELGEEVKRLRRQVTALEVRIDPNQGQLFATPCRAGAKAANGAQFEHAV